MHTLQTNQQPQCTKLSIAQISQLYASEQDNHRYTRCNQASNEAMFDQRLSKAHWHEQVTALKRKTTSTPLKPTRFGDTLLQFSEPKPRFFAHTHLIAHRRKLVAEGLVKVDLMHFECHASLSRTQLATKPIHGVF